jgi:hypothetical protein
LTFDSIRNKTVLFGGKGLASGRLQDTWEYNGRTWEQKVFENKPSARSGHAAVQDIGRQRLVLFGGLSSSAPLDDTWELVNTRWEHRRPSISPSPRGHHAMVYDERRNRIVLYGGQQSSGPRPLNDTWEYDGITWHQIQITGPLGLRDHAMAFDTERGVTVLFGGYEGGLIAETWEYNGVAWSKSLSPVSPPARAGHSLVFDRKRKKIVLFGGGGFTGPLNDTWEYDGILWQQIPTTAKPGARQGASMICDDERNVIVVFGGENSSAKLADTWLLDGNNWTQRSPASPPGRRNFALSKDGQGRILAIGGEDVSGLLDDVWQYQFSAPKSPADECLDMSDSDHDDREGCGASITVPTAVADPDCWYRCTPACPPHTTVTDPATMTSVSWPASCAIAFPNAPHCGDGVCNADLEDRLLCPQDCP